VIDISSVYFNPSDRSGHSDGTQSGVSSGIIDFLLEFNYLLMDISIFH